VGIWIAVMFSLAAAPSGKGQPATQPVMPAEELLDQMLRDPARSGPRPLQPVADATTVNRASGAASVAPGAESLPLLREGTFIIDRVGRMSRSSDGRTVEFVFESDGKALRDPPVVILPNLKLMAMESAANAAGRDLRFRITGMLTEYNGRNYLLLEKVVVVPDQE
ncbi:MAG: hypothetical protein RMJ35_11705, partial [Phycisphaerales bacterium]|nr:hypothetical protein [Phycisphaerales bacterium]